MNRSINLPKPLLLASSPQNGSPQGSPGDLARRDDHQIRGANAAGGCSSHSTRATRSPTGPSDDAEPS